MIIKDPPVRVIDEVLGDSIRGAGAIKAYARPTGGIENPVVLHRVIVATYCDSPPPVEKPCLILRY